MADRIARQPQLPARAVLDELASRTGESQVP
jgi:hypothetical protein